MQHPLHVYRQCLNEADQKQLKQWLVSTFIWCPLLILTLASALRLLPHSTQITFAVYLCISALFMVCWILTGSFKIQKTPSLNFTLALIVALSFAFIVAISVAHAVRLAILFCFAEPLIIIAAIIVAQSIVAAIIGGIVFVVVVGMTMGIGIGIVSTIAGNIATLIATSEAILLGAIILGMLGGQLSNIENHFKTLQVSKPAQLIFLGMIIAHFYLIALYLIGLLRL
jgi:hypothetical protein